MDLKQAYKILEIPENASMSEVKQAYHDLAQIWHPDRQSHNDRLRRKAETKMQELNEAYDFINSHLKTESTGYYTDEESKHRGPTEETIVCPQCGAKNRIPSPIKNSRAKCGRCGNYLFREQREKQPGTEEQKSWISCGDGACIGHIDSTGKCRKCGKTYEEGKAAEMSRSERSRQQQQNGLQPQQKRAIAFCLIAVVVILLFSFIVSNFDSLSGKSPRKDVPAKEEAKPAAPAPTPEEVVLVPKQSPNKTYKLIPPKEYEGVLIPPKQYKMIPAKEEAKPAPAPPQDSPTPEPNRTPRPSLVRQPIPSTGHVRKHTEEDSIARFQIKADQGSHYLVKLVNVSSNESVVDVFVRSGTTVDVKVPLGSYEVRYASGEMWYGYRDQSKDYFGPNTVYSKAEKIFDFQKTENEPGSYTITGYSITLYKVPHGNLHTRSIKPTQF